VTGHRRRASDSGKSGAVRDDSHPRTEVSLAWAGDKQACPAWLILMPTADRAGAVPDDVPGAAAKRGEVR